MVLRDSRGAFVAGLVIEALCVACVGLAVVLGMPVAPFVLVACMWGALMFASYAASVNVTIDETGIRGRDGLTRLEIPWTNVAGVWPFAGALRVVLVSGETVTLRVPDGRVEAARARIEELRTGRGVMARDDGVAMRDGVTVRTIDDLVGAGEWAIPDGVETFLALHKSDTQLLCVNVLVGGAKAKDVAKAARTLAVRAASEHRWDPSFTGAITLRVSELRTPITPKLRALMDDAIAGARADLVARGWTTPSGAPFVLSWDVMGPSNPPSNAPSTSSAPP